MADKKIDAPEVETPTEAPTGHKGIDTPHIAKGYDQDTGAFEV